MTTTTTAPIRCHLPVQRIGGRTILLLTEDASAALPSRGQVAVTGSVHGQEFRTVIEPDGRRGHWIAVDDQLQALLGDTDDGDVVALELSPTKDWPEPEVPGDLSGALAEATDIAEVWHGITPMARWEWVRWIKATKSADTRARRVEVSISKMRSGKRRPCCFDLSSCTDPEISKNGRLLGLE